MLMINTVVRVLVWSLSVRRRGLCPFSKVGLIGCAVYAVFCAVLFGLQFLIVDTKMSVFVATIAAFPAGIMIYLFHLSSFPSEAMGGNYLLFVLSFLIIYCVGWAIGRDCQVDRTAGRLNGPHLTG